jgi:iron-sulfur cluster assembly accessory protein
MKSNTEMEQLDQEIDKWFEELEADLENAPVQESKVDLDRKILDDFHGFAPTIDDKYNGELPSITPKAQIFISQNLEENQYFRFGVEGGGCSGFNYLFDVDKTVNEDDIKFSESPPALIDEMSLKYLFGSEIDLYTEGMNKMLKVTNPGAKASCGCGTSFAFDEDLLEIV